jgi:hypothetical protein
MAARGQDNPAGPFLQRTITVRITGTPEVIVN